MPIFITLFALILNQNLFSEETGGSKDVQVLQAWYGNGINSSYGFGVDSRPEIKVDYSDCKVLSSFKSASTLNAELDCLKALQESATLDGGSEVSPVIGSFNVRVYSYDGTLNSPSTSFFGCSTVELRTVTSTAIVDSSAFDGIGFYFNGSQTFIPKADLHIVGETTLKNGEAALVHRFIAADLCKVSGASKYSAQITTFNVYAKYGEVKRWELENRNHEIGYANGNKTSNGSGSGNIVPLKPQSFDRQAELLKN